MKCDLNITPVRANNAILMIQLKQLSNIILPYELDPASVTSWTHRLLQLNKQDFRKCLIQCKRSFSQL
uniref:Uncharacterized protein n=1 Tax=Arundo donax TaxID=35708 RepID=A0A0A9HWP0_ARUDO